MSDFTQNSDPQQLSTLVPTLRESSDSTSSRTTRLSSSYTVTSEQDEPASGGRTQWRMNIVVQPNDDPDVLIGAIAQAVQDGMAQNLDVTSVAVYTNSQPTQGDLADIGRGFASVDGKGINGDGEGLVASDQQGQIQIELVTPTGTRIIFVDLNQ